MSCRRALKHHSFILITVTEKSGLWSDTGAQVLLVLYGKKLEMSLAGPKRLGPVRDLGPCDPLFLLGNFFFHNELLWNQIHLAYALGQTGD